MLSRSPEDSMEDIDKRSMIWGMFHVFDTGENLTAKQTFEIPEKLLLEQSDEIFGVSQIS